MHSATHSSLVDCAELVHAHLNRHESNGFLLFSFVHLNFGCRRLLAFIQLFALLLKYARRSGCERNSAAHAGLERRSHRRFESYGAEAGSKRYCRGGCL